MGGKLNSLKRFALGESSDNVAAAAGSLASSPENVMAKKVFRIPSGFLGTNLCKKNTGRERPVF